jgi:hypothetical protein
MSVVGQRSIQGCPTCSICVAAVFCLRDVYLDGKHMIRSCLNLVTIAMDVSTGSDVHQDQLRDSPRNQKMTHAGMKLTQHIGTGSIMLTGYRTSTG